MDYQEHYKNHLSRFYTWMVGDFESMVAAQKAFFSDRNLVPKTTRRAVDLGAGPGYQSIALRQLGFEVTAVDTSGELLAELRRRDKAVRLENRDFRNMAFVDRTPRPELVVCMGDTLTHLGSLDEIGNIAVQVREILEPSGRWVATFRDLTAPRTGVDRFIAVRSDAERILTCFLEDEPDSVVVTDLLHERAGTLWSLSKSSYRKLKLSESALRRVLAAAGFCSEFEQLKSGMTAFVATKP